MKLGFVIAGIVLLALSVVLLNVPSGLILELPLVVVGLWALLIGLVTSKAVPAAPTGPVYVSQQAFFNPSNQPHVQAQAIQQLGTLAVDRARCDNCGYPIDEGVNVCPRCRAPMR